VKTSCSACWRTSCAGSASTQHVSQPSPLALAERKSRTRRPALLQLVHRGSALGVRRHFRFPGSPACSSYGCGQAPESRGVSVSEESECVVAASASRRRCSRGGAGRPAGSCPARRARAQPAQLGRVGAVWRLGVKAQALPAGEMEGVDGCGRPADRAAPAGVEAVEGRVARRRRRDPREVSVGEVARLASVWWRAWTIAMRVRAPVPHTASQPAALIA
jgi:hypothetical protein